MKKNVIFIMLLTIALLFTACNTYTYENPGSYRPAGGELTFESDAVQSLDVDWVSGAVTIEPWEGDTICITESAKVSLSAGDRLRYHLDGKTLRIRYMQESVLSADLIEKDLLIRIPADLALTEIELDSDGADAEIKDILCARFELESVSGDLKVTAPGDVQLLDIDTVSGASILQFDTLSHFEIDSVSGSVVMSCQNASGDGEIATVSGGVELALPEDSGFTVEFSTVSGKLTSELSLTVSETRYEYGTGDARYEIETVSANVAIKKMEKTA